MIYGAAVGLLSLVVPIAAQSLVNTVAFTSILQPILILSVVVLLMLGVASVLRIIQTAVVETIQQRIFARIALDLAYRLPRVRYDVFDQNRGTELVNRFFEVLTVQKSAALMLLDGIAVVLQAAIGLILLAFYHPILLAFDVLLVFCIGLVVILPAAGAIHTSIQESKAKYKVAAWLEEIARNSLAFRLSSGPGHALARADQVTQDYLLARKSHFRALIRQISGTLLVQTVMSALLLGMGSVLVIKKQLTLGQLVAAELVVTMVVGGFAKFGKYLESFYDLMASVDKLGHVFDLPLERDTGEKIETVPRPFSLRLQNVSFRYGSASASAVDSLSLEIQAGEKVGIDGINGSGKSTVLDLVVGLRQPVSGVVQLNGSDLRDLELAEFRKDVAFVRKNEIFDGTVLENIRMGREAISLEQVRAVLSRLALLDDLLELPEGLQTELSGSQTPLSAGQTQRLILARALVGKPRLLILDEALENIDPDSKKLILQVLTEAQAPWTLLMATHDAHELSHCERVVYLREGKIEKVVSNFSREGRQS
jgi:ABC-type bacteriocin/lantibiotic exporter with double-glycine peptidase domain